MSWWDDLGDTDWGSVLGGLGDLGDAGGDLFLDTDTGQLVDPSTVDMADVVDMGGSPSGIDPNDPSASGPVPNVSGGPTGTSLSDQLRSRAADSTTQGTEPFDWEAMADPAASIASAAGDTDWSKALAKTLGSLGGLGGLLGGPAGAGAGTAGGLPGNASLMSAPQYGAPQYGAPEYGSPPVSGSPPASAPQYGGAGGAGSIPSPMEPGLPVGGLAGLIRPAMQEGVSATLMRGLADPGPTPGLQAPIAPGPEPVRFTPMAMPAPSVPMASLPQAATPRLSGLQRLLLERLR